MKSITALILALTLFSTVQAQDDTLTSPYALSFAIGSNFRLERFTMDLALKQTLDARHEMRFFLSPRISTQNYDEAGLTITADNREVLNYSLGIGADFLWMLAGDEEMRMFGGTGLAVNYGRNYSKQSKMTLSGGEEVDESVNPFGNAGVRGIIGVEWKVNRRIGIHSEYVMTGSYFWNNAEYTTSSNGVAGTTSTSNSEGITLGTAVLFGLSVYL